MSLFTWSVRVYYEDTDAGNVVYYANYLKFMERARTEWLRQLGFEQDALREQLQLIFMVRSVSIDYLKPARFNDLLEITVELQEIGKASLQVYQAVKGEKETVLCTAEVRLAAVDSVNLKPRRLPVSLLQVLK